MNMNLIGAIMVTFACSFCGLSIASHRRKEYRLLKQLLIIVQDMQSELKYQLTPLPDLIKHTAENSKGQIKYILNAFSDNLNRQVYPDVASCMRCSFSLEYGFPERIYELLELIGISLGRFDLSGQVKSLIQLEETIKKEIQYVEQDLSTRIKCYQTLGICAGISLSVLLL